jgi:hypothetical protein
MLSRETSPCPEALLAELESERRLYRLKFVGEEARGEGEGAEAEGFGVEAWALREGVSELFELALVVLNADARIELKSLPGRAVRLETVLSDGSRYGRSGMIRMARKVGSEGSLARYRSDSLQIWLENSVFGEDRYREFDKEMKALETALS